MRFSADVARVASSATFEGRFMVDLDKIAGLLNQRQPGRGLPRELYTDPEAFEFDMAAIFGRSWIMVGFEFELARPGAWMSTTVGPWPVVITRDRHGDLHAFHNVCRHRGARICPLGKGPRAPAGLPLPPLDLRAVAATLPTPRAWATDFSRDDHGLIPVHLANVGGALYVCVADTPPDIGAFKREFEPLLAPHRLGEAKLAFENMLVEKANWKLAMENARECYHCPTAHPELAQSFPVRRPPISTSARIGVRRCSPRAWPRSDLPIGPMEGDWWQAVRFTLNEGFRSMTMDGQPVVTIPMCARGDGDIGSLRWSIEPHGFAHAAADHLFMFSAVPVSPRETAHRLQVAGAQGRGGRRRLQDRGPDGALGPHQPAGSGPGGEQPGWR